MDLQADIAEHKKRAEELARSLGIVASIDVAGYQRPNGGRYYVYITNHGKFRSFVELSRRLHEVAPGASAPAPAPTPAPMPVQPQPQGVRRAKIISYRQKIINADVKYLIAEEEFDCQEYAALGDAAKHLCKNFSNAYQTLRSSTLYGIPTGFSPQAGVYFKPMIDAFDRSLWLNKLYSASTLTEDEKEDLLLRVNAFTSLVDVWKEGGSRPVTGEWFAEQVIEVLRGDDEKALRMGYLGFRV